jgi:BMFP domain-containing protein YqiC
MNPNDLLNQIQSQLDKTLSGAGSITEEVNQLVSESVTKALSGLDIVSREEFDAQQAVLKRSREKIDLLEKQLSQIEELIKRKS